MKKAKKSKDELKSMMFVMMVMQLIMFVTFGIMFLSTLSVNSDISYNNKVNEAVDETQEGDLTFEISRFCNYFGSDISKVQCVGVFIENTNILKYKRTNTTLMPSDFVENGGDCKSWTVFYRTIFTLMNISSKDIVTNKHVFALAYGNNFYCAFDQYDTECHYLRGENVTQESVFDEVKKWIKMNRFMKDVE